MGHVKKIPLRKCVGCQEMKNKNEMLRILRTGEDEVILDTTGRKNGRGAYVCYSSECFEKAKKTKGLERALKMAITSETYEDLKKEIDAIEGK
ncbi:MAG: YlxR family protein [Lachnospiraceae bacterium]|nr:YlxR family protein [Lachnospiraceae bacterium]